MAEFLVALAEFDAKRVWVELGYPSLFAYLHRELGVSKGAAFYRKPAAQLVQPLPGDRPRSGRPRRDRRGAPGAPPPEEGASG
ncbi:hypothetical protein [Anaeromyxobacter oryzae]|uniref:Uncharacterized protein n=1 Tax=Anaeromyxobacter oryzae TaxID=2918170 RepID=A0ABM7X0Z2_9BACT|nr:hypothetical protein AMOR_44760 [Anaeromyxobacter oryzae]